MVTIETPTQARALIGKFFKVIAVSEKESLPLNNGLVGKTVKVLNSALAVQVLNKRADELFTRANQNHFSDGGIFFPSFGLKVEIL